MKAYLICALVSLLSLLHISMQGGLQAQTVDPDYLDGNIYLKLQDTSVLNLEPYNYSVLALNTILTTYSVDSIYHPFRSGHPALAQIYRLEFSNFAGVNAMITQLELLSFVDYAEKVPLMKAIGNAATTPNDLQLSQWALPKIQAELAWGLGLGSNTVKVAIVDNAMLTTHEDLNSVYWTNPGETPNNFLDDDLNGFIDDAQGYDLADMDGNVNPPTGIPGWDHGSHCSGIAGAATNNGIGIASIGYGITIIPVKASNDATGGNTLSKAFEGVDYARTVGADIISMSWGGKGTSATGDLILLLAENQGILLIAAAGNDNDSTPFFPAASPRCLAVGSTDQLDHRSGFSNFGSYVDVMAPGTDIYSCLVGSNQDYGNLSGTSMACPLTAGLAGLILSNSPGITAAQLRSRIVGGCENIDAINPGYQGKMGAGRINAFNSMLTTDVSPSSPDRPTCTLFPNPAQSDAHLLFTGEWTHQPILVTVYDQLGRKQLTQTVEGQEAVIACSAWAAGIYYVQFSQGRLEGKAKLIVR